MKKNNPTVLLIFFIFLSIPAASQELIEVQNPLLKGFPRIRKAFLDGEKLIVGGNINFVDDEVTAPIVRLNSNGSLDNTFNYTDHNSIEFDNELTNPALYLNGNIYVKGTDAYQKIRPDGTIDRSFNIPNFVNDLISFKDSILTITNGQYFNVYAEDGTFREIDLARDGYFMLKMENVSDTSFLILYQHQNSGEFKYHLFNSDFSEVDSFSPFTVTEPFGIRIVKPLGDGRLFLGGNGVMINSVPGNGYYTLTESGEIDGSSIHEVDLSFLDVYNTGVEYVLPLDNGNFLALGHADNNYFQNYALGRLLNNGLRDESFVLKQVRIDNNYGNFNFIHKSDEEIYLVVDQNIYNGIESRGVNKINSNGQLVDGFDVWISGLGYFNQIENYGPNKYFITGEFVESSKGATPLFTGFSFDPNISFEQFNSLDLASRDIIGTSKILSNGDLLLGAYNRDGGGVLLAYRPNGSTIDLSLLNVNATFVEKPVYNIHESADHIYINGIFNYSPNTETYYNVIKLDKDYNVVPGYQPSSEILNSDNVSFSYLYSDDKLLIHRHNPFNNTNKLIRLMPDGSKDISFQDINFDQDNYRQVDAFSLYDSLILLYEISGENTQQIKTYNIMTGEVLDESWGILDSNSWINSVVELSDTTLILAGRFESINGIQKHNIAIVNINGVVYDQLDLDVVGDISQMILQQDTLILLGPGAINDYNGGGFYAYKLSTNQVIIDTVLVTDMGNVQIKWEDDFSLRSFDLYRSDGVSGEAFLATLPKATTSYLDLTAEPNIEYTYRIVSKNLFGESEVSTNIKIIQPVPPSNLAVEYDSGDNVLSWEDNSDSEIGFQIYRQKDEEPFELLAETVADVTILSDFMIELNHRYSYFVRALSENFKSEPSDTLSIEIFIPLTPEGLSAEFLRGDTTIVISWSSQDPYTEFYLLYESLDSESFELLDTLNSSEQSYVREIENIDKPYFYQMVAQNIYGSSDPTNVTEVSTIILGKKKYPYLISVYPNPNSGNFSIRSELGIAEKILITDIFGKTIYNEKVGKSLTEISGLKKGVYLIRVESKNQEINSYKVLVR